ncbi:hypothetical protein ACVGVM_09765 [Pseudonocardia bannensis]|uniref:Transmembrane protein n=1 Tax=Pseudonocardia bannensis TaxID=630973 RepID=A0A848DR03_9PSEU|nr:hypothetical protein [Pseudonocardia bannensis]NMH95267.1 hypothetical protein [Pseudonocardia bannensis]
MPGSAQARRGREAPVMSELALLPSHRTLRRWDAAAAVTTAVFAVLGVVAGLQVWGLANLHRGLLEAAEALDLTARGIALLGEVPLVGTGADQLADSLRQTSVEVRTSTAAARESLRTLALAVGAALAAIPLLPLALLYVPLRRARRRELRGLRQLLQDPVDPMLIEHLARAALRRVPYAELRRISCRPWLDVEQGRHLHLAAAELHRLGVRSPPGWATPDGRPDNG